MSCEPYPISDGWEWTTVRSKDLDLQKGIWVQPLKTDQSVRFAVCLVGDGSGHPISMHLGIERARALYRCCRKQMKREDGHDLKRCLPKLERCLSQFPSDV